MSAEKGPLDTLRSVRDSILALDARPSTLLTRSVNFFCFFVFKFIAIFRILFLPFSYFPCWWCATVYTQIMLVTMKCDMNVVRKLLVLSVSHFPGFTYLTFITYPCTNWSRYWLFVTGMGSIICVNDSRATHPAWTGLFISGKGREGAEYHLRMSPTHDETLPHILTLSWRTRRETNCTREQEK